MSATERAAMSRAEAAIESLQRRNPLVLRLAEAVSFAVIVDRALLRMARLELVPRADAGTEADLWFSSIVQSRTSDGIVLDREVAETLRRRMKPTQVEEAWRVTSREHTWLSPSLKIEEEIAYLSVSAEPGAHDRMVRRIQLVIRTMLSGNRPGLAQWATRALAMFPSAVRDLPEARMLDAGTRIRLGQGVQTSAEEPLPEWMSLVTPSTLARTQLQVELRERELVLIARYEPRAFASKFIDLPDTNPLVIEVAWESEGGPHARQVTLRRGETARVPVGSDVVRLRTIVGEEYLVREVGKTSESLATNVIDFSEEMARHQRFFGREEEIALLLQMTGRIVITGEHGLGKTALLCELIRRLSPAPVFVHFFREGEPRLESIEAARRSLAAQITIFYRLDEAVMDLPLSQVLERLSLSPRCPERLNVVFDDVQDARAEGYDEAAGPPLPLLLLGFPPFVTVYASALEESSEYLAATHVPLELPELATLVAFAGDERMAYLSEGNFGKAEVQVAAAGKSSPFSDVITDLWRRAPELVNILTIARRPLPHRIASDIPKELTPLLRTDDRGVALLNRTLRHAVAEYLSGSIREPHLELVRRLRTALDSDAVADYYTLYAPEHLLAAEEKQDAQRLVVDVAFMREVIRRHGVMTLSRHLLRVLPTPLDEDLPMVEPVIAALVAEGNALAARPDDLEAILTAHVPRELLRLPPGLLVADNPIGERSRLPPRRHAAPVTGCARVDENHVATWSSDRTLMLWPRDERSLAPQVVRFDVPITAYVQVNDTFAVAGDAVGFVHVVRTDNAEVVFNFAAHDGAVAGAIGGEGTPLVATWSDDGVIRLWSVTAPRGILEEVGELAGHEDEVTGCAFVGGTRLLISSSRDGKIRIWNVAERRVVRVVRNDSPIVAMSVSSDGQWLAVVDEARTLRVEPVDLSTATNVRATATQTHSAAPVSGIVRSDDDRFLATWHEDGFVMLWHIPPVGRVPSVIERYDASVAANKSRVVACTFVGRKRPHLLVSWSDSTVELIDPVGAVHVGFESDAAIGAIVDVGDSYFTGDDRGALKEWSTSSRTVVRDYSKNSGRVDAVVAGNEVLVSDGERNVWFDGSREIQTVVQPRIAVRRERAAVWSESSAVSSADLRTGTFDFVTHGASRLFSASAVGAATEGAAVGHSDGVVRIYHSSIRVETPSPASRVTALAFIEDDTALLTGYANGELTISGNEGSYSFERLSGSVIAIEVDDRRKRFASVRLDGSIHIRSFKGPSLVCEIAGTVDCTVRCRFSLDGDALIGAARDHSVRIWSARTGEALAVCRGHGAPITGLAVGEGVIYSSSEDRTVRMWDINTGEQLAVVYGYNAFRCIDAHKDIIVAGDDAGELWRFTRHGADPAEDWPEVTDDDLSKPADVVIITALTEEREAVLRKLGNGRQVDPVQEDHHVYHFSNLPVIFPSGRKTTYRVVVTSLVGMGQVNAATTAADAIRRWNPRTVLLVGMVGGVRANGVAMGDVLVADQVVHGEAKVSESDPEIRWQVLPTDPRFLIASQNFAVESSLGLVDVKRPSYGTPTLHIGPVATADILISSEKLLRAYRETFPKLVGIDMDSWGAVTAARSRRFFMIRGVSDLAEAAKDSGDSHAWRAYACDVAAAYAIALLRTGPLPDGSSDEGTGE